MSTELRENHQRWLDELVLELRLLDVSGREIGDAVASAREFLLDAGLPAEQAFGSPREYAAELGLAAGAGDAGIGNTVLFAAVDVLGFLAFVLAGGAAWRGDRFAVDAGTAVLVTAVVAMVLSVPWLLPVVLRAKPWKIGVGAAALFAVQVAVVFLLADIELIGVPAWPVAALGLAVLVVSVVRAWRMRDELEDPVVEPLGKEMDRSTRRGPRIIVVPQAVTFVAAWVFVVLDVLLGPSSTA